jgi:hypothetical protein
MYPPAAREALYAAARSCHFPVVKLLCDDEDLDELGEPGLGQSPVCAAAEGGDLDSIYYLVYSHGADLSNTPGKPWSGESIHTSPFLAAAWAGKVEAMELLLHSGLQLTQVSKGYLSLHEHLCR